MKERKSDDKMSAELIFFRWRTVAMRLLYSTDTEKLIYSLWIYTIYAHVQLSISFFSFFPFSQPSFIVIMIFDKILLASMEDISLCWCVGVSG